MSLNSELHPHDLTFHQWVNAFKQKVHEIKFELSSLFPQLVERVDQLLTDYEIKDGHVILQLNSVSSTSHHSSFIITIQNLQPKIL